MNIYPLNYAQEANKLTQLIKQYDGDDNSLFVN
jgi:replication factor A1